MKRAYHPNGQYVDFFEEEHKYVCNEKILLSATSLIKRFFKEFDSDAQAERIASKQSIDPKEILDKWSKNANIASEHGKNVHKYLENLFLSESNESCQLSIHLQKTLMDIYEDIIFKYDRCEPEKIVFSPELGLSGTIDLFAYDTENDAYLIADWKTNKKFEVENTYNKFGFDILSHVPDTKLDSYSLQLNVYKELLLRENYIPKNAKVKLIICHIDHDGVKKNYLAKDYSNEIKKLFEMHQQTNQ